MAIIATKRNTVYALEPLPDDCFVQTYIDGPDGRGFRSCFRDWCSESAKADPEIAEAALSHATGNAVTRAYARSDLFERRRALMDAWAAYATGGAGQVVQLVRA